MHTQSPIYPRPTRLRRARGFTLVEALVAITIVAVSGAVLLLAVESSLQTTWDAVDRTTADGLAQQILDEVATKRYMTTGDTPLSTGLGPSNTEKAGSGRERYDDSDDFHNFSALPAEGIWGEPLGTGDGDGGLRHPNFRLPDAQFANWRQRIEVYYVDPSNHSIRLRSSTSYYRAVEVHIEEVLPDGGVRTLAKRKRVYAYLPPPP